jgi:hypothetical protein
VVVVVVVVFSLHCEFGGHGMLSSLHKYNISNFILV